MDDLVAIERLWCRWHCQDKDQKYDFRIDHLIKAREQLQVYQQYKGEASDMWDTYLRFITAELSMAVRKTH